MSGGDRGDDSVDGLADEASFDELVEIERATALIQDRDPGQAEAVVAARFAARAEREKRKEQVERLRTEAEQKRQRQRRRWIVIGVLVVAAGAAAVPSYNAIREEMDRSAALRDGLTQHATGAAGLGFAQREEWLDVGPGGVSWSIPKDTCSAVVAIQEGRQDPPNLRIERDKAKPIEGSGGQLWCSCDAEQVTLQVARPGPGRVAVRWLATSPAAVGGIEVLSRAEPTGFSVTVDELGMACAHQAFETWSGKDDHGHLPKASDQQSDLVAALRVDGLELRRTFGADRRFGVVPFEKGECWLAVSDASGATVSLRAQDGRSLVESASSPVAWCAYQRAGRVSLWRDEGSSAPYTLLSIEAATLGGAAGLRALASRHAVKDLAIVVLGGAFVEDAVAGLLASTVTETTITRWTDRGLAAKPEQLVVAFSMLQSGGFVSAEAAEVPMGCHPVPDTRAALNAFVCVQARPQNWRAEGQEKTQAAAAAKLPFWLNVLADTTDPKGLQAAARLLGFARRLGAAGFEPSSTFGIEDTDWGAKISGHSNKKLVVAVGITKRSPWVHPLTEGDEWTLEGPLHAITVKADAAVELRAKASLGFDPSARRVVVWRK